jgi:hypothetical protein
MNQIESKRIGHKRNKKLNINLENFAFIWFVLYSYITRYGVKTYNILYTVLWQHVST